MNTTKLASIFVVMALIGVSSGIVLASDESDANIQYSTTLYVGQNYSNRSLILDDEHPLGAFNCNPTTWNGLSFSSYSGEGESGLLINGTPILSGQNVVTVNLNGNYYDVTVIVAQPDRVEIQRGVAYNNSTIRVYAWSGTGEVSVSPTAWNSCTFSVVGNTEDEQAVLICNGTPTSNGSTILTLHIGNDIYSTTVAVVDPTYNVTINTNNNSYGTVDVSQITGLASGTAITVNGNQLTIGSTTVTATPAATTSEYYYTFVGWTNTDGTITANRTITANFVQNNVGPALPESYDVRLSIGQTWSYTPTATPPSATLSISGTATSWITLSNGTVSGTVPNVDILTTYQLVITATTTNPTQTATQTITFTVVPGLEGSASPNTLYLYSGGPIPNTASETISLTYDGFGNGTYTWSMVDDGGIGMTVSANGELGGTCAVAPTSSPITVTVRITGTVSGYTQTDDVTFNVVVVAKLVFTSNPLTDAVIS